MNSVRHYAWFLAAIVGIFCVVVSYWLFVTNQQLNRENTFERNHKSKVENILQNKPQKPILFIGDVMVGRYVETLMKEKGDSYPFGDMDELLLSYVTIANLEGSIPVRHIKTPLQGFTFSFVSTTPALLLRHGVTAVSLANNHSMDHGQGGYVNTKNALDAVVLYHFGANNTTSSDYFETKIGTTTAIIYGINMIISNWSSEKALSVTRELRKEHPHSYLIAFMHWGDEYHHAQNETQRNLAHQLVDSGVDLIIGSHPHVTQGVEVYKGRLIFYSLGNYIFDQYFSKDVQQSFALSLEEDNKNIVYTILPIISTRSRVSMATGSAQDSIVEVIRENSSESLKEQIEARKIVTPRFR